VIRIAEARPEQVWLRYLGAGYAPSI